MSEPKSEEKTITQPTIGTILRQRRKELGWNEQNIADYLRIRVALLQALERGDYHALPGRAYAVGFLKSYAALLGLDAENLVAMFQKELSAAPEQEVATPSLSFPQPVDDHSLPKWFLITIGLAVVLAAYIGWYHFSSHDEVSTSASNTSLLIDKKNDGTSRYPLSEGTVSGEKVTLQSEHSSPAAEGGDQSGNNEGPVNGEALPMTQDHDVTATSLAPLEGTGTQQQKPSPFVTPAPELQSAKMPQASVKSDELPPHVVEIHFTQDSWTKIVDHDGKLLESRIFKSGETWRGDGVAAPYTITAGNAAGIILKAGSTTSAPLGQAGQVKRNVAVSAEAVAQGLFGHSDSSSDDVIPSEEKAKAVPSEPKILDQNGETH